MKRGGALVQPLIPSISEGEWSLVYFDHEFSHAVCKTPKDGDDRLQEHFGSRTVTVEATAELQAWGANVCEQVTAVTGKRLTYARVDAVLTDGKPQLMELEDIDPHLWLREQAGSAGQFAKVIAERLGGGCFPDLEI